MCKLTHAWTTKLTCQMRVKCWKPEGITICYIITAVIMIYMYILDYLWEDLRPKALNVLGHHSTCCTVGPHIQCATVNKYVCKCKTQVQGILLDCFRVFLFISYNITYFTFKPYINVNMDTTFMYEEAVSEDMWVSICTCIWW